MECFTRSSQRLRPEGYSYCWGHQRLSIVFHDVVVFVSPVETDLLLIRSILDLFFRATSLVANFVKSQAFPIRCDARHTDLISELLGCAIASFPGTYLGVPLLPGKLPRAAMQPLVDKVTNWIPTWKGRLLNRSGRLVLVQSTLCAIPVHISMAPQSRTMGGEDHHYPDSRFPLERDRGRFWRKVCGSLC
jgi:hypothetical protein